MIRLKTLLTEQVDADIIGKKLVELAKADSAILNKYPAAKEKLMAIVDHPNYPDNLFCMECLGYAGIPESIGYDDAVAIYKLAMNS